MKRKIIMGMVTALAISFIGCSSSDTADSSKSETLKTEAASDVEISKESEGQEKESIENTSKESDTEIDSKKEQYLTGEEAEYKGITTKVVGYEESEGSEYNKPAEGCVFLLVEFDIQNQSDKEVNISSMISFDGYVDSSSVNVSIAALMEKGDKQQLDGTVASGKVINGVIGYEVPSDWSELEVHFKPDVLSKDNMVFLITK
jgi:hypothetical protein